MGTKEAAAAVSEAFRGFLGAFYRKSYASYSAEDFLADFPDGAIYRVFADCDRLRFSQAGIRREAVDTLAGTTLSYIAAPRGPFLGPT
jgi:hypothetical protein